MKRICCRKILLKLTQSGYSDNGIRYISDNKVSFDPDKLNTAVIEEARYCGVPGVHAKVTLEGKSWEVEMTPPLKKIMTT